MQSTPLVAGEPPAAAAAAAFYADGLRTKYR